MSFAPTRGFLFADLRDYTAYVQAKGAKRAADLLDRYRELVRAELEAYDGAEVQTEGDSFFIVFASVASAVACASRIVASAESATAADPDRPIHVGIGISAGEAVEREGQYVGAAVNMAARLCALARPGEVLASAAVRGVSESVSDARFVARGRHRLKGFPEPVEVFAVIDTGTPRRPSAVMPARLLAFAGLAGAPLLVVAGAIAVVGPLAGARPSTPAATPSTEPTSTAPAVGLATPTAFETATPATSPTASASAGLTASPSPFSVAPPSRGPVPDPSEAQVLAMIPVTLRDSCVRASFRGAAAAAGFDPRDVGPKATVRCRPSNGAGASYVYVAWYGKAGIGSGISPADPVGGVLTRRHIAEGRCPPDAPAWSTRTVAGQVVGEVVCSVVEARPWVYRTNTTDGILGWATRDDTRFADLFDWFTANNQFLP